jgi:hypothetical protein
VSDTPVQAMSTCESCGSLYTEGRDGVDGRCALEIRTAEKIWGKRYLTMPPRVVPPEHPSNHLARRWRVVERD